MDRLFNRVTLNWAGGEHDFVLRLGELRALQDRLDSGPDQINERLGLGAWRVDDLFEILRLGLIGAGKTADEAKRLVIPAFENTPLLELLLPARMVLAAALVGVEDDPVGEVQGEEAPQESGSSPTSMAPDAS